MWRTELAAVRFANEVVFSSDYERRLMERRCGHVAGRTHRHIIGYEVKPVVPRLEPQGLVFGFVGGDRLAQNRRSIEALIRLWVRHAVPHKLVIIGRCHQLYEPCANVEFAGFVADLADYYRGFDALLVFSYVPGGLKTKVPEALAYGVPVILNNVAAEGIVGLRGYKLQFDEEDLVRYLSRPTNEIRDELLSFRSTAIQLARTHWSAERFEEFLRDLVELDQPLTT